MEDSIENTLKNQEENHHIDPAISCLGIYPKETKTERDTCIPLFTATLFTIARKWKQTRCPSIEEWIKQLWYIHIIDYYSTIKRNTFESFLMRWMNQDPIIQSEVSQKENDRYRILMHIYRIQKKWYSKIDLQGSYEETDIENKIMDMERGQKKVRCMEGVTWKLTLPYTKQIAEGNLLYGSGNSNRASVSTQKGGRWREMGGSFKREGIHVYLWLIHVEV